MVTRWAWEYDSCIECGTTKVPHKGHGLCRTCYMRDYRKGTGRPIYTQKRLNTLISTLEKGLNKARIGVQWDGKRLILRHLGQILVDFEV